MYIFLKKGGISGRGHEKRKGELIHLSMLCAKVIQKTYGEKTVMRLRKLENLDCQFWKARISLEFLVNCDTSVVPKFFNICLAVNS